MQAIPYDVNERSESARDTFGEFIHKFQHEAYLFIAITSRSTVWVKKKY